MTLIITYRGRPVAMAGRERFHLAPHIVQCRDGDPVKTFVCYLALYARDVLTGQLSGEPRYLPARVERYAREYLLEPRAFRALAHPHGHRARPALPGPARADHPAPHRPRPPRRPARTRTPTATVV